MARKGDVRAAFALASSSARTSSMVGPSGGASSEARKLWYAGSAAEGARKVRGGRPRWRESGGREGGREREGGC